MVAFHFKHDSLYGPWHCRLYARGSEPDKITSSAFVPKWLPLKQASSSQDLRRQHRRYSSADAPGPSPTLGRGEPMSVEFLERHRVLSLYFAILSKRHPL